MADEPRLKVARLLNRQAELLERAARQVREYAARAESGDVGSHQLDGCGYQFLVDQALREYLSAGTNISFGQAFQAAAEADWPF